MYKIGDIVEGIVSGIQHYGAFIQLPEGTGLVHISEVSSGYVRNIEDFLEIGKTYKFYVIDFDLEHNQAKLSFKKINEEDNNRIRIQPKNKSLNKNKILFDDTLKRVNSDINSLEIDELSIYYNSTLNNNIEDKDINSFDFIKYPSNIIEKDILSIKEGSNALAKANLKLVVVSPYEIIKKIENFASFFSKKLDNVIFIDNASGLTYTKQVIDSLDEEFGILLVETGEYTVHDANIYRLLRKKLEEYVENSSSNIFISFNQKDEDIIDLINKEWYNNYKEIEFEENLLSPSILFVLSFIGLNIYDILSGYRKAIIDNENSKMYLKIRDISTEGNIDSLYLPIKRYLENFKDMKLNIDVEYRIENHIQLPKFKDHLRKLNGKEGKYIEDDLNNQYSVNIVLKDLSEFSFGYLTCLLYIIKAL